MHQRILITGTSGFSGSHLFKFLRDHNHHPIEVGSRATWGNLADPNFFLLWQSASPDAIIHVAAQSPGEGITNTDMYRSNVQATYNVIQYAKRVGVKKIIYFSSTSIFGEVEGGLLNSSPIINPNFYGQTKLMAEELLRDSGIPTVSLRLPLIVGKGAKRNWLARMVQDVKAGKPITIYNPEMLFNNAVHIEYLCGVIEELLDTYYQFQPFLLASKGYMTIREVVDKIVDGRVPINIVNNPGGFIIESESPVIPPEWSIQETIARYALDEFGST